MDHIKTALAKLEIAMFQLGTNTYDEKLAGHLAPDFYEFAGNGKTYTKADILKDIEDKNNSDQNRTLTPSDFRLHEIAQDIYLLTYKLRIEIENIEQPILTVRSSIWSKISGDWLLKFHQATPQT